MSGEKTGRIIRIISIAGVFMLALSGILHVNAAMIPDEDVDTEVMTESVIEDSSEDSETVELEETETAEETVEPEAVEETTETVELEETEAVEETETAELEETEYQEKKAKNSDVIISGGFRIYNVNAKSIDRLQSVLTEAAETATDECPSKVIIEPGIYTLSKTLRISSNTYLSMHGVTFLQKSGAAGNMLKIGINSGTEQGYCYKNIILSGGTWNKNQNSGSSVIKVGHAANFCMDGVTVMNVVNGHLMEAAGINGFYIKKCTFMNQINDMATLGSAVPVYEAIQFDILEKTHMKSYASEDLKNQNIVVEDSTFQNVPRGVGNHTSILNNPTENVKIERNLFESITDVAIRGEGYLNLTIRDNEIRRSRSGIMILSLRNYGGTYLGSTLASESQTEAVSPSYYCIPVKNQKIVIENNTILCDDKMITAESACYGILIEGVKYTTDQKIAGKDTIPAGDYFISGVKIVNNRIDKAQYGIALNNTKKATVKSNQLNSGQMQSRDGIYFAQGSTQCSVISNTINGFSGSGILFAQNSSAKSVSNNKIGATGKYGICVQGASVQKIVSNNVTQTGNKGIVIYENAKVEKIEKNIVGSCKEYGIVIGDVKKNVSIQNNTVTECNNNQIYVNTGNIKYKVTITKNKLKGMLSGYGIMVDSGNIKVFSNKIDTSGVGVYLGTDVKGIIEKNAYKNMGMYQIYAVNQYNDKGYQTYTNISKPGSLKATAKNKTSIRLTWKKIKGAEKYEIYRAASKNGTYKKIAAVSEKSRKKAGGYIDKRLKKNKRYYYKIRPYAKSPNGKVKMQGIYSKMVSAKTTKK